MMLICLRGTPFLYYGDEIGLPDVPLDPANALDPVPRRTGKPERNRDPCRTPMQWSDEAGAGFTEAGGRAVAAARGPGRLQRRRQRDDPGSQLHLTRDLIALRRAQPDLRGGDYETLPAPAGAWAWRRGERHVVALNISDAEVTVDGVRGPGGHRHRPRPRRRDGRRRADARRVAGRGRARRMSVEGLDPLLSPEGWVYASTPPVAEGDPGRYHALFGRDSLITALQVLPARPDVARATLRALAALQGQRDDPETDEEPGKILHEYRPDAPAWHIERGWPVRDGELRYYGSADSTSWFLVLLAALGDDALTAELEPAWRAAGGWLERALVAAAGWSATARASTRAA